MRNSELKQFIDSQSPCTVSVFHLRWYWQLGTNSMTINNTRIVSVESSGSVFRTLHFLFNLWMAQSAWVFVTGKPLQPCVMFVTLAHWAILMLRRKWSVVWWLRETKLFSLYRLKQWFTETLFFSWKDIRSQCRSHYRWPSPSRTNAATTVTLLYPLVLT